MAGLAKVTEKNQIGNFRMFKEVVGHNINGNGQSLCQRTAVNDLFHINEALPKVFVDIQDDRLVEILLFSPVIVKSGNINSYFLGDHPGSGSMKTILSEDLSGHDEDPGLHGFRIFAGFF